MKITKGYDFDDVLIVPKSSEIYSREEVSLVYTPLGTRLPIIASPMKGIMNFEFAALLSDYGLIGILHRFYDNLIDRSADIVYLGKSGKNFGASIGLDEVDKDITKTILDNGAKIICIDVANGYLESLLYSVDSLANLISTGNYYTAIMAGNVVTYEGANGLYSAGAEYIRVGIGSGGLCTTRNVTGIGYPQISAIDNCKNVDAEIVSDGGIRNSGDIVKALAAGADVVMVGSLFATAFESANNGIIYGMASKKLQEEYYHDTKSIEGIQKEVKQTRPLQDLIDEISWGLKSACTYLNVRDIMDISNNVEFVEVGRNTIKSLE